MQWLTGTPNFNFVKYRYVAMLGSGLLSLVALVSIFYPGMNYGLDFTGGVIVEGGYSQPPDIDAIRTGLVDAGFESAQVQTLGSPTEVIIRLPPVDGADGVTVVQERVLAVLRSQGADVTIRRLDSVAPQVGEDLAEKGRLAMIVCELLLRGPQTPGELRTHAGRLAAFSDVAGVEQALEALASREDGPFVARLPREPGRRESRYAQLFTGTPAVAELPTARVGAAVPAADDRLERLEQRVVELEMELAELKRKLAP